MGRNKRPVLVVAACILALSLPTQARVIYVSNSTPADANTIQAGIDAAVDGDVVLVAPRIYTGDGNRDIDFKGKAITLKSQAGSGTCTIQCGGSWSVSHRGFYFHNHEDSNSVLDGFTITGGHVGYTEWGVGGGGVLCDRSSPVIRNCVVQGNTANSGAGLAIVDSDALVVNCIIAGNQARFTGTGAWGGGIVCSGNSHTTIRNCTICGNLAEDVGGGVAFGAGRLGSSAYVVNCILANNKADLRGNQVYAIRGTTEATDHLQVEIELSCIQSGSCTDIWQDACECLQNRKLQLDLVVYLQDPLFAVPGHWDPNGTPDYPYDDFWVEGDYRLKSQAGRWDPNSQTWVIDAVTSPCIDAGDPNSPVGEEPLPNGGRINMGAYGGTSEASKSYFNESSVIWVGDALLRRE